MKGLKSLALLLAVLGTTLFFACNKENTDTSNIIEDITRTDTTRVSCDTFAASIRVQFDTMTTPVTSATLTITVFGGVQPYKYRWSTSDSTQTARVTSNGTYSVTVTDARGCSESFSENVTFPTNCANLRVSIAQTSGTTLLTANPTGGVVPYTYKWSTGATTQNITTTGNGAYSVTVTDRNGCITRNSIVLTPNCAAFKATINMNDSLPLVWVTPISGAAPYAYTWSTGATSAFTNTTGNGTYSVTVTDANGCTATDQLTISYSPACGGMALRLIGDSNSLTAVPSLGLAPYTYRWTTGASTNTIPITSGNVYGVTVTDSRGCTVSGRR